MIKNYIQLIKPKIIIGNLISLTGGFLLTNIEKINYLLLATILFAMSLIIGSSCVFNNLIDINIDRCMQRTNQRVLVIGLIKPKQCIVFGLILGILGFIILIYTTNKLVFVLAALGFIIYVIIYSMYMKQTTIYSTIIGSISGGIPPVIGYCAANQSFNSAALILWIIFIIWQMPHFYAISIIYLNDYKTAAIPTLAAIKGIKITKYHIIFYIISFMIAIIFLTLMNYTNNYFLIIMESINIYWLFIALKKICIIDYIAWGKKMFFLSIFVVIMFNILISINHIYEKLS